LNFVRNNYEISSQKKERSEKKKKKSSIEKEWGLRYPVFWSLQKVKNNNNNNHILPTVKGELGQRKEYGKVYLLWNMPACNKIHNGQV
jgi:hypothetical protein